MNKYGDNYYDEEVYGEYYDTAGNYHWTGTLSGSHVAYLEPMHDGIYINTSEGLKKMSTEEVLTKEKECYGRCKRCVWKYNKGCSEWRKEKK